MNRTSQGKSKGIKKNDELQKFLNEINPLVDGVNLLVRRLATRAEIGCVRGIGAADPRRHEKNEVLDAIEQWLRLGGVLSDFFSPYKKARKIIRRLWDCNDVLPNKIRSLARDQDEPGAGEPDLRNIRTYGQLARHLFDLLEFWYDEQGLSKD